MLVRLVVNNLNDLVYESRDFGFQDVENVLKVLDLRNYNHCILLLSLLHQNEFAGG